MSIINDFGQGDDFKDKNVLRTVFDEHLPKLIMLLQSINIKLDDSNKLLNINNKTLSKITKFKYIKNNKQNKI